MVQGGYEQQITNCAAGYYLCLGILIAASATAVFLFFQFRIARAVSVLSGREKKKALAKMSVLILAFLISGSSVYVLADTQDPEDPDTKEEQAADSTEGEAKTGNIFCLSGAEPAGDHYYTSSSAPRIVLSCAGEGITPERVRCEGEVTIQDSAITVQYEALPDGEHSIEVCGKPFVFIVDTTAPEVSVLQTNRNYNGTDGTLDYYNNETEFILTVYDRNPDPERMSFTCHLNGTEREIELLPKGETGEDRFTWTGSFLLDDPADDPKAAGDTLCAISGEVFDLAGNPVKKVSNQTNLRFLTEEGKIQTDGVAHTIRIDKTAPSIRIEVPDGCANARGKVSYYKTDQTVKVILTDRNLQPEASKVSYTLTEDGKPLDLSVRCSSSSWIRKEEGICFLEIPLADGQELSGLRVTAKDYAKHSASDSSLQDFCYITDSSPPEVQIEVTGDGIESFFTSGTDVFAKFSRTAAAASGQRASGSAQTVTLQISVTDANIETRLSAGYKKPYYVKNEIDNGVRWEGRALRNQVSTVTYTQSVAVRPESSGELFFRVAVTDLAGNAAEDFLTNLPEAVKGKIRRNSKGRITGKVIADRERPFSGIDKKNIPILVLSPDSAPAGILEDQTLLYSGDIRYHLTVADPADDGLRGSLSSGLESVRWTVESDQPGLIGTSDNEQLFFGAPSAELEIPVILNGTGETDDITLKVTVTDRAGNATTYEQKLAMDNEKPRVSVVYDNQDVKNNRYFRESRTAEIVIRDLNFDPAQTFLRTQGELSEWVHSGIGHTAVVRFSADGDYTLEMTVIDKAQNPAEIDFTNGGINAAPQDFTIDRTKPVIGITFDRNDAVNGKYFNKERTATVTVEEKHFDKEAVAADMEAFLDGEELTPPEISRDWTDNGDSHSAEIFFREEGDYSGTVRCTDLAGNEADVRAIEAFTVDKTPPLAQLAGIRNGEARKGQAALQLHIYDRNLDEKSVRLAWTRTDQLTRTKDLLEEDPPRREEIRYGGVLRGFDLYFGNPDPNRRENDGIYRLFAAVTDLAGNKAFLTDEPGTPYPDGVLYCLNRFGSVYDVPDSTEDFRKTRTLLESSYANEAPTVSVRETNPNALKNQQVSLAVNGSVRTLTEGADYEIEQVGKDDTAWRQTVYHIFGTAFLDEAGELLQGEYAITLYSEDDAGNINSNRAGSRANRLELGFVLDNEPPTGYVSVEGLPAGKDSLKAKKTMVDFYWEDNTGVAAAELYVNGKRIRTVTGEDLGAGTAQLPVFESSGLQSAYAVITDPAGNQTQLEEVKFYLNSSGLRQFLRRPLLPVCVTAAVLAGLLALKIHLTIRRRQHSRHGSEGQS